MSALDLRAVGRSGAGHHDPPLLLDPAERRDVLVRAEEDSGLARAGLRGEVSLPLDEAMRVVRQPARHGRRVSVSHRTLQHRTREPVDLEEYDSGRVRLDALTRATCDALDDSDRVP